MVEVVVFIVNDEITRGRIKGDCTYLLLLLLSSLLLLLLMLLLLPVVGLGVRQGEL